MPDVDEEADFDIPDTQAVLERFMTHMSKLADVEYQARSDLLDRAGYVNVVIYNVYTCNLHDIYQAYNMYINQNYNFLQFSQDFFREKYCFFVRETSRLYARRAPGLSGNFCARALKLIADTDHGVGSGPGPYSTDSVSRRAGRYLET